MSLSTASSADSTAPDTTMPILSVKNLFVDYVTEDAVVPACYDVNLEVMPGEIIGVAGESGSGKSTLLAALGQLQRTPAVTSGGSVTFHPRAADPAVTTAGHRGGRGSRRLSGGAVDLTSLTEQQLKPLRWTEISIVMQSAMACLNPVARLRAQFIDVLREHRDLSKAEANARAEELLEMVSIPPDRLGAYPHELSGGMQQRVLIALAMACHPSVVLMDEPTTAVDVVLQRKILNQLIELQKEFGFAIVFVTHDLSLLMEISDRIAVMYAGRVVEVGTPERLYTGANHPYTRGLRDAFPPLSEPVRRMSGIPGNPPDLANLPDGCAFADRCTMATEICHGERPLLLEVRGELVACHHPGTAGNAGTAGTAGITGTTDKEDAESSSSRAAAESSEHNLPSPALATESVGPDPVEVADQTPAPQRVLEAKNLRVTFPARFGRPEVRAVDDVDFHLDAGEIVAVVGESGSGKSTLARTFARLTSATSGSLTLDGQPITEYSTREYTRAVQMIFQDPFNSMNSLKRVSHIIGRVLALYGISKNSAQARETLHRTLETVNLSPASRFIDKFPADMSGGQRQRISIARALAVNPRVLLADEPTSMLDASMRIGILNLLSNLRRDEGVSIIFITHDIASARYLSDRIVVMSGGKVVETGRTETVIQDPQHEYTKQLLRAAPDPAQYKRSPAH